LAGKPKPPEQEVGTQLFVLSILITMKLKNAIFMLALVGASVGAFSVNAKNVPQDKENPNAKKAAKTEEEALHCSKSITIDGATYTNECWFCKCSDIETPKPPTPAPKV